MHQPPPLSRGGLVAQASLLRDSPGPGEPRRPSLPPPDPSSAGVFSFFPEKKKKCASRRGGRSAPPRGAPAFPRAPPRKSKKTPRCATRVQENSSTRHASPRKLLDAPRGSKKTPRRATRVQENSSMRHAGPRKLLDAPRESKKTPRNLRDGRGEPEEPRPGSDNFFSDARRGRHGGRAAAGVTAPRAGGDGHARARPP